MRQDLYQELFEVENNHWWHEHKRAVVHQMIDRYADKGKVLDIGAGTGKMLAELKEKGWKITGVDGEKEAIEWSKKRGIKIQRCNLRHGKLPFKANSFDLVLALDVLEHLTNTQAALTEAKRVVKPGGLIIATTPAYQWLYGYWDKMLGHRRRYTSKTMKTLFRTIGLKIKYLGYFSTLWFLPAVLVRKTKSILRMTSVSDFQTTPLPVFSLSLLKTLSIMERRLLRNFKLPFGLSVICIARKK